MVEAKDLRIGNIVGRKYFNPNPKNPKQEIEPCYVVGLLDLARVSLDLKGRDVLKCDYELLEPIPLTKEWIIKFGFSDKGYKDGYIAKDFGSGGIILDFVLTKPFVKGEWQKHYAFDFSEHRFVQFEFVHELQNFFYCAAREDLQII